MEEYMELGGNNLLFKKDLFKPDVSAPEHTKSAGPTVSDVEGTIKLQDTSRYYEQPNNAYST